MMKCRVTQSWPLRVPLARPVCRVLLQSALSFRSPLPRSGWREFGQLLPMSEVAHALPPSGEGRVSGERTHGYNYLETRASGCAVQRGVGGVKSAGRPISEWFWEGGREPDHQV